ncbi:hypothetical protein Misp03_24870 [Microbispora sp. NBRC 16548]|nr:hypothetical protein Misp03_24870 [Microbispora sp. NBRC 16548]
MGAAVAWAAVAVASGARARMPAASVMPARERVRAMAGVLSSVVAGSLSRGAFKALDVRCTSLVGRGSRG